MTGFTFQTTRSVLAEPGGTQQIAQLLSDMGVTKPLLVTDCGVLDLGLADPCRQGFDDAKMTYEIFSDVVADPPEDVILKAVVDAKAKQVDGVVGLGGGSSMDVAKLIAFLVNSDQPLDEIYGIGMCRGERLPLILAPTTAGTGSEVTPISIVTTGAAEKKGVVSRQLLPDWAVLDADLTVGLPKHITAATGIDAMVHAIEAYTSKIKKNALSDCLAREALAKLGTNIRTACEEGHDRHARSEMLVGAMLAGMAFTNAPVAAVHALAYPLGGHFHVPHGLSNSLVLPEVMKYNRDEALDSYGELAAIVFPDMHSKTRDQRADAFGPRLQELAAELGLETRLRDVGVSHNHLPTLAEDAMKQTRLLVNNPREMTYEAALAIYEATL